MRGIRRPRPGSLPAGATKWEYCAVDSAGGDGVAVIFPDRRLQGAELSEIGAKPDASYLQVAAALGEAGWEMVLKDGGLTTIFKRPKK